jgi:hypothetical protein
MTKAGSTRAGAGKTTASADSSSWRAAAREARAERLAAALKANLGRRKAQARERVADAVRDPELPAHEIGPVQTAQVSKDEVQDGRSNKAKPELLTNHEPPHKARDQGS